MRLRLIVFIILFLVLTVCSCSVLNKRPRYEARYYNLEYPSPTFNQAETLPAIIKMAPFKAAPQLDSLHLLYRDQSFQIKTYPYHRWRAYPSELVGYFLLRDMRSSGLFRAVLPNSSRSSAPYVLEGSVDKFLEKDGAGQWEAVLNLSITLIRRESKHNPNAILLQKEYRAVKTCAHRSPSAVAEAMSRAMAGISKEIILDLYTQLKAEP
jgi:ABC-type uncharacterized transport system auxiliary subunit